MSPRELLDGLRDYLGERHPLYPMFEALVKAVEPEDTDVTIHEELGNCADGFQEAHRELAEARATIRKLREEHHEAMTDMAKLRFERTQALQDVDGCKFIICKLQKQRDMFEQNWKDTAAILGDAVKAHDETIDEAQAEIERLRKECNLEMAARMMGEPLSPGLEARFEELKTLAETGRLVHKMRKRTALRRFYQGTFAAAEHTNEKGWCSLGLPATTDPTEALATIQERAMTEKCKLVSVPDLLRLRIRELERTVESLTADASLGKSVREMRPQTRFTRGCGLYWADINQAGEWKQVAFTPDLAEALQAIQGGV